MIIFNLTSFEEFDIIKIKRKNKMKNENEEVWKDVVGYEGLYQVSNLGRVKSLKYGKERILKSANIGRGYLKVNLWRNREQKQYLVHRLVGQSFIPNPNNLPEINHRDEDKTNNKVVNLEWCSSKYNANFGTRNQRQAEKCSKTVFQYTKTGEFVKKWKSTHDVERNLGYDQGHISACCLGKYKSAYGFIWKYK